VVSVVSDKIRSRGYWDVVIRPGDFTEGRVPYGELEQIITRSAVRLRGWPVPFVTHSEIIRGDDWLGQDVDADMLVSHYEAWRFWTSGQFAQLRAVGADWREGLEASRVPRGYDAVIEVWEVLYYVTEVFELAARLALTAAGGESMSIKASLHHMANRGLIVGQINRMEFAEPHSTQSDSLTQHVVLSRDTLISQSGEHAVSMAREFFLRFGWNPTATQLNAHQDELTHRSGANLGT
jgi:hypothetical protein